MDSSSSSSSSSDDSSSNDSSSDSDNDQPTTLTTTTTTTNTTATPSNPVLQSIADQLAMLQLPPDPSILNQSLDEIMPDFQDGYDANFMGDEEDQQRLMRMNELDRETELGIRADKRREGIKQVDIIRTFLRSLQDQYKQELINEKKNNKGKTNNNRGINKDNDDSDSDVPMGGKGRRGANKKRPVRGRKPGKKVAAKKKIIDSDDEEEKNASDSESSSSSSSSSSSNSSDDSSHDDSSSDSESSSDDDSESSEDQEVGGRRLRKTVARTKAAQRRGSSDDEEGEYSSMVKLRGKNKIAANNKKRAERNRARYGTSDSELDDENEDDNYDDNDDGLGITSLKDIKKGLRSTGKSSSGMDYIDYDDEEEFIDDDNSGILGALKKSSSTPSTGSQQQQARTPGSLGTPTTPSLEQKVLRSMLADKSDLLREATANDINANVRLTRSQAQRLLSHPHFKEIVTGCYVKFPQAISNPNDPAIREALQKGTISRYRIGRIVEVGHSGRFYDPYQPDEKNKQNNHNDDDGFDGGIFGGPGKSLLKAVSADMVRNTDLVFVIAVGSNRTTTGPGGKLVPRVVRIKDISNHSVTDVEWRAYTDRLRSNHSTTNDPDDLVPIREILVTKANSARELQENPTFTREQTEKTLRERTRHTFTGETIKNVINPAFSRTLASEKLQHIEYQLKNLDSNAVGVENQRKLLERDYQEQKRIIQEIDRDEERRRDEARKLAERRLRDKKQVSALSSVVNMELIAANRERMHAAADIERVRDDKAAQAEINENPFMRRRTVPSNLFNVKGGKAIEAEKNNPENNDENKTDGVARTSSDTGEKKAPVAATKGDLPVPTTSLHLHDEIDAGDISTTYDLAHSQHDLELDIGITTLSSNHHLHNHHHHQPTAVTTAPTTIGGSGISLAAFRAKMLNK